MDPPAPPPPDCGPPTFPFAEIVPEQVIEPDPPLAPVEMSRTKPPPFPP